ncbi:AAA family ATPase [Actinokineospora auranticolor]|uniref:AAA family ATPase n=1 Tax=Actinokineospora auranticolor TaxID=155976 RepID=UPI001FE8E90A|nr:AAA family ATPase [Actinokineospora auranticolor]
MPRVLVTGMSGTGKSTVLAALGERGHLVVDTDTDEWSRWVTLDDGSPDWIWREDAIGALLDAHPTLFVAGCKSNQGAFYDRFEHVVLLSAPVEVMLDRIATRVTNPYGKTAAERAEILRNHAVVEPLLRKRATLEIDTSAPLDDVVARLLGLLS